MNEAENAATEQVLGNEENLNNEVDADTASLSEDNSENENSNVDATEDTDERESDVDDLKGSKEEKSKSSGIQRRFQKFNQQLEATRQELDYWKKVAIEGNKVQPEVTTQNTKPKLEDFNSVEDYIEAREKFMRADLLRELETVAAQKTQQETTRVSYQQRVESTRKEISDWEEVMLSAADEVTAPETVQFCMDSNIGPKIAYHLAKNPELHDRINSLSPIRRIAELGKLEEKLTAGTSTGNAKTTKAPQKISEISGGGTPVRLSTDAPRNYTEWKKAHEQRTKANKR